MPQIILGVCRIGNAPKPFLKLALCPDTRRSKSGNAPGGLSASGNGHWKQEQTGDKPRDGHAPQ
jgi:hypothetical protein